MTAVPDPFRDQLAEVLKRHDRRQERVHAAYGDGWKYVGCTCGWGADGSPFVQHQADALAAVLEARVQAAANQRAAEELRSAADDIEGGYTYDDVSYLRDRAAALTAGSAAALLASYLSTRSGDRPCVG